MACRHAVSNILQQSQEMLAYGATQVNILQKKYRELILRSPETVSKIESILRALSYMLPGHFGASGILAELLFSASQLLTLLNDGIIREGSDPCHEKVSTESNRILLWLTVVEYLEVFIELGAGHAWGEAGKWLIVVVLQITKAALRFVLLFKYNSGIQRTPLILPLDRSKLPKQREVKNEGDSDVRDSLEDVPSRSEDMKTEAARNKDLEEETWRGVRSGRRVRSLAAAPPGGKRAWKVPNGHSEITPLSPTDLSTKRLFAESLYITRPLLHVLSMFWYGQNSWKPWLLSCGVDVTSLALFGDPGDLNETERSELSRRTLLLLFYLLRSPFYDTYSKTKILGLLKFLNDTVPGISFVLNPLLDYLPTWQKIYFYNWSS